MEILIVSNLFIPVKLYGGIERAVWSLGKELVKLGHKVTYLVKKGSYSDFATVVHIDESKSIEGQIPKKFDVIHFFFRPQNIEEIKVPYIITIQVNSNNLDELHKNTIFVSKDHAHRYNSDSYVYNGLDWDEYTPPDLNKQRSYFHFLAKASWRVKNVRGAINVIKKTRTERLKVLGGVRFNFNMGIRFTFSQKVSFAGMVGGAEKDMLLNNSKGLIFPVIWNEPFGIAIIESLYYGCPVFGTPYGSLPELVINDVGYLSNREDELANAVLNCNIFSSKKCHEYALYEFNSKKMALEYIKRYEIVISGKCLNKSNPRLKKIQEEKFLKLE